jgi:hypothetical protein
VRHLFEMKNFMRCAATVSLGHEPEPVAYACLQFLPLTLKAVVMYGRRLVASGNEGDDVIYANESGLV